MAGPAHPEALTMYLRDPQAAGRELEAAAMPWVYGQLRAMARSCLRRGGTDTDLQPTILIHEAWLKLLGGKGASVNDREHFLALAARAMRQLCVDEARARRASKRGGDAVAVTLDEAVLAGRGMPVDMIDLDEALKALHELDPREARAVELRLFGGLSMAEVAEVLGVSLATAEREWRAARAWLARRLQRDGRGGVG